MSNVSHHPGEEDDKCTDSGPLFRFPLGLILRFVGPFLLDQGCSIPLLFVIEAAAPPAPLPLASNSGCLPARKGGVHIFVWL